MALKVLKPELGAVLDADRFLTEIQVTAQLQHPNLLPLFDSTAPQRRCSTGSESTRTAPVARAALALQVPRERVYPAASNAMRSHATSSASTCAGSVSRTMNWHI